MEDQIYENSTHNKSPDGGWFPVHVAHATDPALIRAEMALGNEAIGLLIKTMAHLRLRPGYSDDLNTIPALAYKFRTDSTKLSALINDFGLFQTEDGLFYCPWLSDSMYPLDEKRRKLREAGRKGGLNGGQKRGDDEPPPESHPEAIIQLGLTDEEATPKPPESNNNNNNKDITQQHKTKQDNKSILLRESFELFWTIYDKKTDRKSAEKLWVTLTDDERAKATDHAAEYVRTTPDKQYRKDPATYLRKKSFENEFIISNGSSSTGSAVVKSLTPGTSEGRIAAAREW